MLRELENKYNKSKGYEQRLTAEQRALLAAARESNRIAQNNQTGHLRSDGEQPQAGGQGTIGSYQESESTRAG